MKREQFLSRLRRYCRKTGISVTINEERGKGYHITVAVNGRATIVKAGELKPHYIAGVLKQLGLPPEALS